MENRFVGTIIYNRENKSILLVKNSTGDGNFEWSFPAGKIKKNETELEAAIREVKEETTLTINKENTKYLNKYKGTVKRRDGIIYEGIIYVFWTEDFKGIPKAEDDAIECKWFSINTILDYDNELSFIYENTEYKLRQNTKKALKDFLKINN